MSATPPGLRLTDVHKSFGPTAVIMGVSLDVARGSRHAIIGPNGAGKTTLFNLISGRFPVSSGTIELNGRRIDSLAPHEINRRGLSRSFQVTSIFAPNGIMGLVEAHGPIVRAGRFGRLVVPYVRVLVPGLVMLLGFVGVVELASFLTIGAAQGKTLVLFGSKVDVHAVLPWLAAFVGLVGGLFWFRIEARSFRRVWDGLMSELKPQRSAA